jgi:hypothetical protein
LALGGGSGSALSRCLMTGLPTRENPPVLRMPGPPAPGYGWPGYGWPGYGCCPGPGRPGPEAGPGACQAPVFLPWPN